MIKIYLRGILSIALQSSWRAANGLWGAAIAGAALIWPGILTFASTKVWWAEAVNWLGSFVVYAAIAWVFIFAFQLIFLAPHKLWRREYERITKSEETHRSQERRNRQIVKHDKDLATRLREVFPEGEKQKLTSDLWNQHAYWSTQGDLLSNAVHFLGSAETYFLDETLRERAKDFREASAKLLHFMAYKFFVFPNEQRESPLRFAMQPNWNVDREGNGSAEQEEKYGALTAELEARTEEMSESYDELIKAFHTQLLA